MIDRDSRVTTDELHAYVDGVLPADRHIAVEAWLATHPDDAAQVADWRAQAEAIRAHFGAVATLPTPARFNIERLTQTGRNWRALAAVAALVALVAFGVGSVAGWIARDAAAASPSRFDLYTTEALDAHKLYVVEVRHPVEVPGNEREHLGQWLSKRLDYELRIPDLDSIGLKLVGGRLLPGPFGPAAFYMYEGTSGERYTLYSTLTGAPLTAMRYKADDRFAALYWVERDLAYVLSGPDDRERLQRVAEATYDQIDKGPGIQRQ
jgi:anti-sigma factor RsiW